jgi:hypothetical protein
VCTAPRPLFFRPRSVQYGVDYVAASQVTSRSDIESLRNFLDEVDGENIRIIAKIETVQVRGPYWSGQESG